MGLSIATSFKRSNLHLFVVLLCANIAGYGIGVRKTGREDERKMDETTRVTPGETTELGRRWGRRSHAGSVGRLADQRG